jgi:hypothetical protein
MTEQAIKAAVRERAQGRRLSVLLSKCPLAGPPLRREKRGAGLALLTEEVAAVTRDDLTRRVNQETLVARVGAMRKRLARVGSFRLGGPAVERNQEIQQGVRMDIEGNRRFFIDFTIRKGLVGPNVSVDTLEEVEPAIRVRSPEAVMDLDCLSSDGDMNVWPSAAARESDFCAEQTCAYVIDQYFEDDETRAILAKQEAEHERLRQRYPD